MMGRREKERITKEERNMFSIKSFFFFFSSRRRHTRCSRDWSSDVCSSDLAIAIGTGSGCEQIVRSMNQKANTPKLKERIGSKGIEPVTVLTICWITTAI